MTTSVLELGAIQVRLTFKGDALHAVDVPVDVPEELDSRTLRSLTAELSRLPLDLDSATGFTRRVWERLRKIPWGSAMTYAELAAELGSRGSMRAVGQACGRNRLLLVIPCHRVVAENGVGGFALGVAWKRKLLELETEPAESLGH